MIWYILKNAATRVLATIGADTAENEPKFAENLPKICQIAVSSGAAAGTASPSWPLDTCPRSLRFFFAAENGPFFPRLPAGAVRPPSRKAPSFWPARRRGVRRCAGNSQVLRKLKIPNFLAFRIFRRFNYDNYSLNDD